MPLPEKTKRQHRIAGNLTVRARVLSAIREHFSSEGYLEVETPVRVRAPLPEAHIEAVAADGGYLQTSPEAFMKRLLAEGYPKIFQVCRCFRKGERGARHLPEFTLLEWYEAGKDYRHLMDRCEALVCHVARRLERGGQIAFGSHRIDLRPPWPRLTVEEAFDRYADRSLARALSENRFDEVVALQIEPQLGLSRPVFVCDYPSAHGALARSRADRPDRVERFELYMAGLELCNGFSELTDPVEQRRRFEQELDRRRRKNLHVPPMPERFLSALARMPASAGNALGVDRLVMLFAGAETIDEVTAFVPEEL